MMEKNYSDIMGKQISVNQSKRVLLLKNYDLHPHLHCDWLINARKSKRKRWISLWKE